MNLSQTLQISMTAKTIYILLEKAMDDVRDYFLRCYAENVVMS